MPYIKMDKRPPYDRVINDLRKNLGDRISWDVDLSVDGEINYLVTRILDSVFLEHESYQRYERVIGLLECIKLEFSRRKLSLYEDRKITSNGDVFD